MTDKLKIFGQLESGVVGGFVTDATQIKGLSEMLSAATAAIKTATSAEYISSTGKVVFKDKDKATMFELDASPFVKDGMLDRVELQDDNLTFTFNTESGKQPISIPIDEIFNPKNYYTKTEVDAISRTSEAITIAGGPLADDLGTYTGWPDNWKTADGNIQIPADCTLQEFATVLFLQVKNGTVSWSTPSWNPSLSAPTIALTNSGKTVEVGTKVTSTVTTTNTVSGNTRTSTLSASQGYFESLDGSWKNTTDNPKSVSVSGTTSGSVTVAKTWNGTTTTVSEHTVIEGTNTFKATQSGITASVRALPATTVYASTNTKKVLESVKATLSDTAPASKQLTKSAELKVTGIRYMFWGADNGSATLNSATIRTASGGGSAAKAATTKTLDASGKTRIWVAAPSGITLNNLYNSLGADLGSVMGSVTSTTVSVEGANGFTAATYTLYVFSSDAALNGTYTIVTK